MDHAVLLFPRSLAFCLQVIQEAAPVCDVPGWAPRLGKERTGSTGFQDSPELPVPDKRMAADDA